MAIFVNNKKRTTGNILHPTSAGSFSRSRYFQTIQTLAHVLWKNGDVFCFCVVQRALLVRLVRKVVTNGVRSAFQLHSSFRVCMGTNTIRRRRSPEQRETGNGLLVFTRGSRVVVWRGTLILGRRWCHRWILVARRSTIPVFRGHIVVPWVATV